LGHKRSVVANSYSCRNVAQRDDPRTQTHHRLYREPHLRLLALLDGIVARMVAVQDRSWPHHVRPCLRARDDGGAVGAMYDSRVDAQGAQARERSVKPLFLLARLLANRRAGENFRGGKVRKDAGELQMAARCELPRKAFNIGRSNSQSVHSCIDFQMKRYT